MFFKQLSSEIMVIGTPAKVNLYLEVLRRREDGYHDINSLFQTVSLFDRIRFERTDQPGFSLKLDKPVDIPTDDSNLMARAYEAVRRETGLKGGMKASLEKNIPVAAGLAGGSADAAATIFACNRLFDLGLDQKEMAGIGLQIGSDLPFFFSSGQALVTGRGEHIEEVSLPLDYWLVLITPRLPISTAASYAGLHLDLTKPKNPFRLSRCRTAVELTDDIRSSGNDFEEGHFSSYPVLGKIKDDLLSCGADLVRMSGSGPTMFGIYTKAPDIEHGDCDSGGNWQVNLVRPVMLSENGQLDAGGNSGDH